MTYGDLSDQQLIELHLISISGLDQANTKVKRPQPDYIEVTTTGWLGSTATYKTVLSVKSGAVEVLFNDSMIVHHDIWKFIKQCQEWDVDYD